MRHSDPPTGECQLSLRASKSGASESDTFSIVPGVPMLGRYAPRPIISLSENLAQSFAMIGLAAIVLSGLHADRLQISRHFLLLSALVPNGNIRLLLVLPESPPR